MCVCFFFSFFSSSAFMIENHLNHCWATALFKKKKKTKAENRGTTAYIVKFIKKKKNYLGLEQIAGLELISHVWHLNKNLKHQNQHLKREDSWSLAEGMIQLPFTDSCKTALYEKTSLFFDIVNVIMQFRLTFSIFDLWTFCKVHFQ